MIHLYIDGAEVHLPEDISIDYYVYNPFFERKGEYTYDIDINLKDPVNAKVYNMAGQYVGKSADGLSKGLYVVNGKKIVVK